MKYDAQGCGGLTTTGGRAILRPLNVFEYPPIHIFEIIQMRSKFSISCGVFKRSTMTTATNGALRRWQTESSDGQVPLCLILGNSFHHPGANGPMDEQSYGIALP